MITLEASLTVCNLKNKKQKLNLIISCLLNLASQCVCRQYISQQNLYSQL